MLLVFLLILPGGVSQTKRIVSLVLGCEGFGLERAVLEKNVDFIASAHIFIVLSLNVMRSDAADILRPAL